MEDPHFDERFGPDHPRWHLESPIHLSRYFYAAEHVRGKRVLDAGTGLGYGASVLKASGASEVQAVDIDASSIEKARDRFRYEGLEYLVDDCEKLSNVRGPFDVICNFENIEHLNRPEDFLAAAARHLKDDGVFFCSTPDRANSTWKGDRPDNPYHVMEWFRDEFRALLSRSFEEVDVHVQVEGLSLSKRRNAMVEHMLHVIFLENTPLVLASRGLGKLAGKKMPSWDLLPDVMTPTMADYPIVPEPIGPLLGKIQVHYAICRRPRRA